MFVCTSLGIAAYLAGKFLHLHEPVEKAVEHVLGSSAHQFLEELLHAAPHAFEADGLPRNHELRKASLHSLSDAGLLLADALLLHADPSLAHSSFWSRLKRWLARRGLITLGSSPETAWVQRLIAALRDPKALAGFDDPSLHPKGEPLALMRDQADAAVAAQLQQRFAAWASKHAGTDGVPSAFDGFLVDGWPLAHGRLNLFQAYCLFFREQVKHQQHIFNLLAAGSLADINAKLAELKPGTQPITLDFNGALRDQFTCWLSSQLGELRAWLDTHFDELRGKVEKLGGKLELVLESQQRTEAGIGKIDQKADRILEKLNAPPASGPSHEVLLHDYLVWLRTESTPVRLTNILKSIAEPGKEPPQLHDLYTELNTDLDIPKALTLQEHLRQPGRELHPDRRGGEPLQEKEEPRDVTVHEALGVHDRLVLIGDAGSGKSTVGQFLALALSEARLGEAELLPRLGSWWSHGALLPVPVVLRQFASWLPALETAGCAQDLWDFIRHDFDRSAHPGWQAAIAATAAQGGALFLLDGWDETRDPVKLVKVAEALTSFLRAHNTRSRFLLASRPYAWQTVLEAAAGQSGDMVFDLPPRYRLPWIGRDASDAASEQANVAFQERARQAFAALQHELPAAYTVDKLNPDQTKYFIGRWYFATKTWWGGQEAQSKEQGLQDAMRREDLAPIAQNPLLLTLAAATSSGRLPEDRADLFNEIVELLLKRWTEHAGDEKSLRDALDPQLSRGLTMDALRDKIEKCAYDAHAGSLGKSGVADIPEAALEIALASLLGGSKDQAGIVLDFIEKRAGLLLGKGLRGSGRQFSCPHRAFQEFLAGCHLERRRDFELTFEALARQDAAHWNDALCFAARRAKADRGSAAAEKLVHRKDFATWSRGNTPTEMDWRCAVLAARLLQEIGLNTLRSDKDPRDRMECVAGWLAALIEQNGLSSTKERAEVGQLLAQLGDPRPGVASRRLQPRAPDSRLVPDLAWCGPDRDQPATPFPAGEFQMGGDPAAYGSSKQAFPCTRLTQRFLLGRYPVTVEQYQLFVEARGYEQERFWTPAGRVWLAGRASLEDVPDWTRQEYQAEQFPIRGPKNYAPAFQTPNHPRVGVSWHEAVAYCRWLNASFTAEQLGLPGPAWQVRLPTDAEWERAARQPDQRLFPWGPQHTEAELTQRCNWHGTGLGQTSAVGLFPDGRAACGALDMAGNVWEWCQSRRESVDKTKEQDAYNAAKDLDADEAVGSRVLRGGSWAGLGPDDLRAAFRFGPHPGSRRVFVGFRLVGVGGSR